MTNEEHYAFIEAMREEQEREAQEIAWENDTESRMFALDLI